MLNLKREANQLPTSKLELGICPICNGYVSHVYFMQNADTKEQSKWYSCSCGVVWNSENPGFVYDEKYWKEHDQFDEKLRVSFEYPVRIYAPIIEELIYGRRVLLVGKVTAHQENYFAERGWVPHSIDKNTFHKEDHRTFVGDFENYIFPEGLKFNMIWLYQTLECFLNPTASLIRASELLTEDGIIFIGSPDTDFIHTRGSSGFKHWKPDKNYLMFNRASMSKHLEKLGFNVILARQNYEHRFPEWDDFHIIAQKKFF